MDYNDLHPWDVTPKAAIGIQKDLRSRIQLDDSFKAIRVIAGADVAFDKSKNQGYGGVIAYNFPELEEIERQGVIRGITFPYVPGLLAFREAPILLEAFAALVTEPDVILFDGQGIAHFRRMGIATHMGIWLDRPTIGCAKSRLIGSYASPGMRKGDYSLLFHKGRVIGAVLRTREQVKPLFISPGNHMNLEKSIEITLSCLSRYRIPEPVRQAHLLVNQIKRDSFGQAD